MACFDFGNYCGKIKEVKNDCTAYKFSYADLNDADQIARMYAEISINEKNYNTKLEPENKKNYERTGGMFIIHTKESIEAEIKGGKSFFAVIKNSEDEIIASLWVSQSDPSFAGFNASDLDFRFCLTEKAPKNGNILFPREIIIDRRYRFAGISGVLCYTVFSAARINGLMWALGEVYKVYGYNIGGIAKEVCMLNNSGYKTITGMSGSFIGTFPLRNIQIKSLRVIIEPQIFVLNIDETLTVLEQSVNNSGFTVYWEHNNEN